MLHVKSTLIMQLDEIVVNGCRLHISAVREQSPKPYTGMS